MKKQSEKRLPRVFSTAGAATLSIVLAVLLAISLSAFPALAEDSDNESNSNTESSIADTPSYAVATIETTLPHITMTGKMPLKDFNNESLADTTRVIAGDGDSGDTVFTVEYYEHYAHDEDGNPTDAGTRLLGTRTLSGKVGQEVDAWDYVVNLPGFFFFDGWPANMTLVENTEENVIELYYMRLSVYSYTVNYYAMTGADLTADTWTEALATNPEFYLLGTDTVDNQLFDSLIDENDVNIPVDGLYTVGTFPETIRVHTNPDDNIINVLYVPQADNSPGDSEETNPPETPDNGTGGNNEGTDTPDVPDAPDTEAPDDNDNEGDDAEASEPPVSGNVNDNNDNSSNNNETIITDDMLEHPINKDEAMKQIASYDKGTHDGAKLIQTGDELGTTLAIAVSAMIISIIVIIGLLIDRNRKN